VTEQNKRNLRLTDFVNNCSTFRSALVPNYAILSTNSGGPFQFQNKKTLCWIWA